MLQWMRNWIHTQCKLNGQRDYIYININYLLDEVKKFSLMKHSFYCEHGKENSIKIS